MFAHLPPSDSTILAYGRAFACLSAASIAIGHQRDYDSVLMPLVRLLDQRIYIPTQIDFHRDCKPYLPANRNDGTPVVYVPSWARAGVRYISNGIDIRQLDPADWYHLWWDAFRNVIGDQNDDESAKFRTMYASLGEDEDTLRSFVDNGQVITDRVQIRRLALVNIME